MKIRLEIETVEVDAEAWANEFGVDMAKVREDIKAYFRGLPQQQIEVLGLEKKKEESK